MNVFPVVNSLLYMGFKEKVDDLNSLKLQKMLYFLSGWYLAITNEALIDQHFIKGKYGPVIPDLVQELKKYGSEPIDDYILEYDTESCQFVPFFVNLQSRPQFIHILEQVWKTYYPLTSLQLSSLASCDNSPWQTTLDNQIIDNEKIKQYFIAQSKK